jgi:lysophospholipase L1-like esterase
MDQIGSPVKMVNASLGATRLLAGPDSALSREGGAALAVPGVGTIVLTDLINDIQQTPHQYNPRKIDNGLRNFVSAAHDRGVRVIVTTIPPYGGFMRYEPDGDRCRQAVNSFIRTSGVFDGFIDFDSALADPTDPTRIRPGTDSGDHLHPNNLGHQIMAATIDLTLFKGASLR